jgi:hypothetical protein
MDISEKIEQEEIFEQYMSKVIFYEQTLKNIYKQK